MPFDPSDYEAMPQTATPAASETAPAPADPMAQGMEYLQKNYGWTPNAAAGIMGNLHHESGGLNPTAVGDGGKSVGLAQWNGPRLKALASYATAQNKPIDDPTVQLDFINHEMATDHQGLISDLMNADSPEAAARLFSRQYERPGKPMMDSRIKASWQALGASGEGGLCKGSNCGDMVANDLNPKLASAGLPTLETGGLAIDAPARMSKATGSKLYKHTETPFTADTLAGMPDDTFMVAGSGGDDSHAQKIGYNEAGERGIVSWDKKRGTYWETFEEAARKIENGRWKNWTATAPLEGATRKAEAIAAKAEPFNPENYEPIPKGEFNPADYAPIGRKGGSWFGAPGGPLEERAKEMQRLTKAGEAPFTPNVAGLFQMGSEKRLEAEKRGLYGSMSHFADKFLGNAVDLFGKALDALGPIANEAGVPIETRPEPPAAAGFTEAAVAKQYPYLAPAIKAKPLTPGAELVKPISDYLRDQARKMAPEGKSETFEEKVFEGLGQLPMLFMKYGISINALGTTAGMMAVDLLEASDKSPMEILEAGVGAFTIGKVMKGAEPLTLPAKTATIGGLFGALTAIKGGDATDITSSTALGAMLGVMGGRGNLTAREAISDAFKDFKKEYGRLTPKEQAEVWEAVRPDKEQQERFEEGLRKGAFRGATPEELAKDVEPVPGEVSKAEAAKEVPPGETSIGPFQAVRRGGRTVLRPFDKAEQPNLFEQGWVPGRKPTDIWYPLDEREPAPEGEYDVPGYTPTGFVNSFRGPATTMYDFAERNLPFLKTFVHDAKLSLNSTPHLIGSKYFSPAMAIPKEGGLTAARQTERYATDPIYRAEVEGLIDRISDDIVNANNKIDLLEDSITNRYSGGPDTREWFKKAREKLLGNDPLMSIKKEDIGPGGKVRATYTVNVTRAWNMEAKNKYGSWDLGDIAVREALQNSTDAVMKALEKKEVKQGRIAIEVTPGSYAVDDNGVGMSDIDIRDKFLALHGTGKDKEGDIGGFGVAKAVELAPSESAKWTLETRDNYFDGDMASNFDEIKSVKKRQGTRISVKADEYITTGKALQFAETSEFPKNVSVTFNGQPIKDPFTGLRHKTEYSGPAGEGNTITVRYYPKAPEGYNKKIVARLEAPGRGVKLTQMLEYVYNNDFKGAIVADVTSNKTPGKPGYPFSSSRNNLRSEAEAKVQAVIGKYSTDVLSAQRAGIESVRLPVRNPVPALKEFRDSVLKSGASEGVKNVASAAKFAGVETTPLDQMDIRHDTGTPVPVITPEQASLVSAMEGTLRLTAKMLNIPIGKFYLRHAGVVDGGVVVGEWSHGDFGYNWTTAPPEIFTNPVDAYLYLKELVDHELTHHYVGPHNEAFTSRHGEIIKAGDEKLMNSTLMLAEAVTGKKASQIREVPASSAEAAKQLGPQQRSLFAEQSGGFDYGRRPELLEPTGTDRPEPQRPLPGTEPRGAIGKGPGEEILPKIGRPGEFQVRPSAERTGPGSLPAKSAARARGVVEGLERIDAGEDFTTTADTVDRLKEIWPRNVDRTALVNDIKSLYPEATAIKVAGSFARGEPRLEPGLKAGMKVGVSDLDVLVEIPGDKLAKAQARDDTQLIKKWAGMQIRDNKEHIVDVILKAAGKEGTVGEHRARLEQGLPVPEVTLWSPETGQMFSGGPDTAEFFKKYAPIWRSKMREFLSSKLPGKGTGGSLADTIRRWADKGEFKNEELRWSGLVPWLKEQKGPVSKQMVMDFLNSPEHRIEIEEVWKGGPEGVNYERFHELWEKEIGIASVDSLRSALNNPQQRADLRNTILDRAKTPDGRERLLLMIDAPAESVTKFSQYTLPGGENYREVLLRVPGEPSKLDITYEQYLKDRSINIHELSPEQNRVIHEQYKKEFEAGTLKPKEIPLFQAPHWEEPNVFSHVRVNDRRGPKGEKILFIEELQSDWALEGRRKGFEGPETKAKLAELEEERASLNAELNNIIKDSKYGDFEIRKRTGKYVVTDRGGRTIGDNIFDSGEDAYNALEKMTGLSQEDLTRVSTLEAKMTAIDVQADRAKSGIPPFPFSRNWHEVALKRMLRYAAENGYDEIAWTTGEQQAERYDLSKYVNEVSSQQMRSTGNYVLNVWDKNDVPVPGIADKEYTAKELEGTVGKDLATKIIKYHEDNPNTGTRMPQSRFSGLDLKIGGEWAYNLYDRMIPSFLNKYGKQWGARVGETRVGAGDVYEPVYHFYENAPRSLDKLRLLRDAWRNDDTIYSALSGIVEDIEGGRSINRAIHDRLEYLRDQERYRRELMSELGAYERERIVPRAETVYRLSLTPTMKRAAVEEGQYMFSGSPDTSEWFKDVWNAVKESRTARGSSIEWTTLGEKASKLWEKLRGEPAAWGDYKTLSNKYLGDLQIAGYENEMMRKRIDKAVPDKARQAAITNWIEAGGDPKLLRARADATKDPVLRRGYEMALDLTQKELDVAREGVAFYDKMLKEGQAAGMLEAAFANYVNHIWGKDSTTAQRLRGEINAGLLNTNFSYARKRIWSTYFEGEQQGRIPKDKSISYLMGRYFQAFHEANAARQAIKSLTEGKTADGMPIVTAVGGGDPVPKMMPEESRAFEDVPMDYDMTGRPQGPDAYLIKPRKLTSEQAANYRYIDHPALRKWKWIGNDWDGNPMLMQGDLWVHKDHFKHLSNMLKKSAIREHWLGGPIMTGVSSLKGTLLTGSPFHQVHVASHGLMHLVNIADLPELDFSKPLQQELVRHGLMVYNHRGMAEFGEGVYATGLVNKIPGIGPLVEKYGKYMFQDYIPRLKMKLGTEAFERNMRRYGDKWSRDQILELTANQANAAFGELNYKAMGRNPTIQDILRLVALAPDFLEARARFVGQAFRPGGKEQAYALTRGALGLAGIAAIGSMLFGDKEHGEMGGWNWKDPFSLNIGKKKYTIRSVPGDLLHLMTNPRNFFFWRLNPSTVRPLMEMSMGRDVWGRRRSFPQQVGDYFSSHVPIPAQPLVPSLKRETSLIDGALRSIGVASYPYKTAADQAMMDYFMEARIDRPSTSEMEAVQKARRQVLALAREGKENEAVDLIKKTGEKYKLSPVKALDWLMEAQHPENIANFKRLPLEVMAKVMNLAEPAEEQAFIPILLDEISNAKPDKLEMALPELEKYMESVERRRKRGAPAAAPAPQAAPAPPAPEPAPRPFSILGGR